MAGKCELLLHGANEQGHRRNCTGPMGHLFTARLQAQTWHRVKGQVMSTERIRREGERDGQNRNEFKRDR